MAIQEDRSALISDGYYRKAVTTTNASSEKLVCGFGTGELEMRQGSSNTDGSINTLTHLLILLLFFNISIYRNCKFSHIGHGLGVAPKVLFKKQMTELEVFRNDRW